MGLENAKTATIRIGKRWMRKRFELSLFFPKQMDSDDEDRIPSECELEKMIDEF
jgi:hypothetical protein